MKDIMGVKKTYFDKCNKSDNINYLRLDKIKVLKCDVHGDCTYHETVHLSFFVCDKGGNECAADIDNHFNIILIIETGYLPYREVSKSLVKMLEPFDIVDVNTLVDAFKYRQFYCNF